MDGKLPSITAIELESKLLGGVYIGHYIHTYTYICTYTHIHNHIYGLGFKVQLLKRGRG